MLQMEADAVWFERLNDAFMARYRRSVVQRGGRVYINQMLQTKMTFLQWMEERGLVRGLICEGPNHPLRWRKDAIR